MANFVTALSKTLTVFLQAPRPLASPPVAAPSRLSPPPAGGRRSWDGSPGAAAPADDGTAGFVFYQHLVFHAAMPVLCIKELLAPSTPRP